MVENIFVSLTDNSVSYSQSSLCLQPYIAIFIFHLLWLDIFSNLFKWLITFNSYACQNALIKYVLCTETKIQDKYLWITCNGIVSLVCMTEMFTKLQCNAMRQVIQILPHLPGLQQPGFTLLSAWTQDVLRCAYCSPTSISVAKVRF